MSFPLGSTPKTATGFTLPSSTPSTTSAAPTGGFQFNLNPASGDNKQPTLFSTPFKPAVSTTPTSLSFGLAPSKTTAPTFSFGSQPLPASLKSSGTPAATTTTASNLQFNFGSSISSAPSASTAGSVTSFTPILGAATTSAPTTGLTLSFLPPSSTAAAPKLGLASTTTTSTASVFASSAATVASIAPTQTTTTTSSIPATGSLSFARLEDLINRWTIDLEEQGKFFVNQAKQLNAWDTLLISNGEKILNLNSSIERVKQQQSHLDQELDFILAQQKELEELLMPLEKELLDIPVTDIDRNQMYQFAEIIDSQLKQISDDLKEIIENINESNKDEEISNPITQISKILNAHMNSLQWIDRNTAQISHQLEEISKIEDANRRNLFE